MKYKGLSGKEYNLKQISFKSGGEGNIHEIVGLEQQCAKIYHKDSLNTETEEKLKVMVNNPPNKSVLTQIAWPLDILYTENHEFVGFVMPKINVSNELIGVYEYPPTKYKNITFQQRLIIAQNICAVINGVHEAGFVFGDFNPKNIGVDMNTGHVAFWDTDSYHITDNKTGVTYRCKVCLDGYVAPELLQKCKQVDPKTNEKYTYESAPLDTFTKFTDLFALSIHIFKLLMNGYTPFAGRVANQPLTSTTAPAQGNLAVERDEYCFKTGNVHIAKAVPDKSVLPNEILQLFDKAFIEGKRDPHKRPTAREWHKALLNYENQLEQCKVNHVHQYKIGLAKCPWCEIDKTFNLNIQNAVNRQKTLASPPLIPSVPVLTSLASYGNNTYASTNKVYKKSKIKLKVFLIIETVLLVVFGLYDAIKIKDNFIPEYEVLSNGHYYEILNENGTSKSIYIVDRYGNANSKVYEFEYQGSEVEPLKIRTDYDVVVNIRVISQDTGVIFNDSVTCFKGKEKELKVDFVPGVITIEVSSNNKNFDFTLGVSY